MAVAVVADDEVAEPVRRIGIIRVPLIDHEIVGLGLPRLHPGAVGVFLEHVDGRRHAELVRPHLLQQLGDQRLAAIGRGGDGELGEALAARKAGLGKEFFRILGRALDRVG